MSKEFKFIAPDIVRSSVPNLTSTYPGLVESNGFYHTESDEETKNYLGFELEQRFGGGANTLRELYSYLGTKSVSNRISYGISGDILRAVKTKVFDGCSQLLYANPHFDGGGIECVIKPCTLTAIQTLKDEFVHILNLYKNFGFTDILGGDGIHANMDLTMFGSDVATQKKNMANFLWFIFYNSEFVVDFSGRTYNSQLVADMYTLIGDTLGRNMENMKRSFLRQKDALLNAVEENSYQRFLNMTVNRDGRPCLEFRWFGSTQSGDKLLSMAEFCYAIVAYVDTVKNDNQLKLHHFCAFVKRNVKTYPHLFEDMASNVYSKEFMILQSSAPQSTRRDRITIASV